MAGLQTFFYNLVHVMDRWVFVMSLLAVIYLIVFFKEFYRKFIVASYILVLSLFMFWSVRSILQPAAGGPSLPLMVMSFILDTVVIVFAAAILYHYQRLGNIQYIRRLLGLRKPPDLSEVVEYGGPEQADVDPGNYYLVVEEGYAYQWQLFNDLTRHLPGLYFSRKHPSKLDIETEDRTTEGYWLSESASDEEADAIDPFRRGQMKDVITDFVTEHENPVVLIDGLEYLIDKTSAEAVVHFIQDLSDIFSKRHDLTLIYSIDKDSLSSKEYALLKEEVDEIRDVDDSGHVIKKRY